MPTPRQPVPALSLPTVGGGTWTLGENKPERFTLVAVYRGLHCPVCAKYIKDFDNHAPEFAKRGIDTIAISTDTADRAAAARQDWALEHLRIGHDLPLETARAWGLYISTSRGKTSVGIEEPAKFAEPGLFLIRADGTLYFSSVQTMPFARPHFDEVLKAADFVIEKDYPARGEA